MYNITYDKNDLSFFNVFYELFNLKNVFVENHGLLSVILYYTQVIMYIIFVCRKCEWYQIWYCIATLIMTLLFHFEKNKMLHATSC
jgi:hypothetical protein